jgi:hypothetical protein
MLDMQKSVTQVINLARGQRFTSREYQATTKTSNSACPKLVYAFTSIFSRPAMGETTIQPSRSGFRK